MGPATRLLPRHPPSRFLQVQKPGFFARLAPTRDTCTTSSTCTSSRNIFLLINKVLGWSPQRFLGVLKIYRDGERRKKGEYL